jgi:cytochrome c oxidase assembly factor CtaG
MAEHLLLVLVVAPLLVWGWRTTGVTPSWSVLPFLLYVILIPTYHLTPLGGLIMRSPGEHALELSLFAIIGITLWVGPYGQRFKAMQRVTYVALALPASIFAGVALMSATTAPFNLMSMPHMPVDIHDLHQGGVAMAVLSTLFLLVHIAVLARIDASTQ